MTRQQKDDAKRRAKSAPLAGLHAVALEVHGLTLARVKVPPRIDIAHNGSIAPSDDQLRQMKTETYDADPHELSREQRMHFANVADLCKHDGKNWLGRLAQNMIEAGAR